MPETTRSGRRGQDAHSGVERDVDAVRGRAVEGEDPRLHGAKAQRPVQAERVARGALLGLRREQDHVGAARRSGRRACARIPALAWPSSLERSTRGRMTRLYHNPDGADFHARIRLVRTRTVDVVETLHGVAVADPYRWLEDGDSPEVRAWDEAQTAETRAWLARVPGQQALRARVEELLSVGHVGVPVSRPVAGGGRRYFHVRREGEQQQAALYVRDGVDAPDRALIDPGPLSADGTTAIDWWSPSNEGARVAWGLSEAGSEESTLRIRDVATGKDLADAIPHTRHATVAWLPGGESFYYTRYPAPGDVPAGDEKYSCRVYRHAVGADWRSDPLVFGEGATSSTFPRSCLARRPVARRAGAHGMAEERDRLRDLATAAESWVAVAAGQEALYEPLPLDDRLYLVTNEGAPRYRLVEVDYAAPTRDRWRQVLAEHADALADVAVIGGAHGRASYLHEASARIERFGPDGAARLDPAAGARLRGYLGGVGRRGGLVEPHVVRDAFPGAALRPLHGHGVGLDRVGASVALPAVRVSAMLYATSKDGTRMPMFVVEKEGTARDGDRPAVLYGYGGFNIAQTPAFSARTSTVEHGGVWAVALLRGGAEFGEEWHRAGMLEKKQNVFDNLYACAEELFRARVTRPDRLGVVGGSNGGLLVAAAVTQRPEPSAPA